MRKFFGITVLMLCLFLPFSQVSAQVEVQNEQTIIHLLNYVAMDYPMSVENGKVLNEQEYQEQLEFSAQVYELAKKSPKIGSNKIIFKDFETLKTLISQKKSGEEIKNTADRIKEEVLKVTGIKTAPKNWPNLQNGEQLYTANCALCHGTSGKGDGVGAKGLEPQPTKFIDEFLMKKVSPFHAYNSIKLGVPGTAMRSFSELDEQQMWDLAFYVKTLAYKPQNADITKLQQTFNQIYPKVNLAEVATLSDEDLFTLLKNKTSNPEQALVALRILAPTKAQQKNSLEVAKTYLLGALQSYKDGNKDMARNKALSAYLEGIEPVETRLRTQNPQFVLDLEQKMMSVRQAIEKNSPVDEVSGKIDQAMDMITKADGMLHGQKLSYWLTFIMAISIMLREGLEAFLVLAVVLALIRSSGIKKALPWVHGGWITAVLLGIAGWFLSDFVIRFGGKNREIMEGLVSLFAVVVLLSVGFWLHNNSYAKQWKNFIENRIGGLLKKENMIGLAVFSFMVVFREVFEIILFLQAINLEADPHNKSAIGFGVLAAIGMILIIAYLFLKYSKMIPVRKLFLYSSWVVVVLAIILVGKGIHSLQESGWISFSSLPRTLRIDWLGVYPSIETIGSQVGLLTIILCTYFFYNQKRKKAELK